MKLIQIIETVPGWDFKPGDVVAVSETNANYLVNVGAAIEPNQAKENQDAEIEDGGDIGTD